MKLSLRYRALLNNPSGIAAPGARRLVGALRTKIRPCRMLWVRRIGWRDIAARYTLPLANTLTHDFSPFESARSLQQSLSRSKWARSPRAFVISVW